MYQNLRTQFLNFFKTKDHLILPSSGLIPHNDPSLMFTNSGMVQFKNVFLGLEKPAHQNVSTVQKSLRAGGKHNDLDNVGYTARHHTFFEMLGNFSFTGYFKDQAITYAWDFLTKEVGLSKSRLYVTIFHNDDEAFGIWKKVLGGEDRIIRITTNDNFWMMGDSGPCGPCSEIFYDYGDSVAGGKPGTSEQDGDRYVEVWNLVFMEFNQQNGTRTPLTQKAIDTGMGLERLASVLEGKTDNYDTSLFFNLRQKIGELYSCDIFGKNNIAGRVVADHIRAISFMIAEGITPSNEGRGYVLRRIMRRAMRYLHQIDENDSKMHKIVDFLDQEMGTQYSELHKAAPIIKDVIATEEQNFKQMLDRGLRILDEELTKVDKVLSGDVAFKLYDTYGFPLDLTQDILRQKGISVDVDLFDKALQKQKETSKAAWKGSGEIAHDKAWFDLKNKFGNTEFVGYDQNECKAEVLAIVGDWIVFDKTVCYPEGGGQVADFGKIDYLGTTLPIFDVKKMADSIIAHKVSEQINLPIGALCNIKIDLNSRKETAKHHSATHLLQAALQKVLGIHIAQKGSKVEPTRLTFDFSHGKSLMIEEIKNVENIVNENILKNLDVLCANMSKIEAEKLGAMALFGEKYGEVVRVVQMGGSSFEKASVELCGGTHVKNTGFIGSFKIISESSVASGVRRIEAKCGQALTDYLNLQINDKQKIIEQLTEQKKQQSKEIEKMQIQNCILSATKDDHVINVVSEFSAGVVREAVIFLAKKHAKHTICGLSKTESGLTYVIFAGNEAIPAEVNEFAKNLQTRLNIANIKEFAGKVLIFGSKI